MQMREITHNSAVTLNVDCCTLQQQKTELIYNVCTYILGPVCVSLCVCVCVCVCVQLYIISYTCSINTKPVRQIRWMFVTPRSMSRYRPRREESWAARLGEQSLSSRHVVVLWHQMKAGKPMADKVERGWLTGETLALWCMITHRSQQAFWATVKCWELWCARR